MAVVTMGDLMGRIQTRFADDSSDETIALIEDINDTLSEYERRISESGDWERKYAENDSAWRERYKARFFDGEPADEVIEPEEGTLESERPEKFEDLFTEKGE